MKLYSAESIFLKNLISELNNKNIKFAVMRNYASLPFCADGSDLDIIVWPGHAALARTSVLDAIKSSGGVPIGLSEAFRFLKVSALGRTKDAEDTWWGLCVDLNFGFYYRGFRILEDDVLWPQSIHNGVPVLSEGFASVLGVIKEVLNNDILPKKYVVRARVITDDEWSQIRLCLKPIGNNALNILVAMIKSDVFESDLYDVCREFRWAVVRQAYINNGINAIFGCFSYNFSKLLRYIKPSGIVIAFLGVDGVGKSSVINSILPALNSATHNSVVTQHLRPSIFPPLARLKGKKLIQTGPVLEPHGALPSGPLGSILRLFYLVLDYVIGYWFWTRPKIAKQPTIVIFDRYAYDMSIDPLRFRIKAPFWLANWAIKFVPRPDIIICLYGDPLRVSARKMELSESETRRQIELLKSFATKDKGAVMVSTDVPIAETREKVLDEIFDFLARRI